LTIAEAQNWKMYVMNPQQKGNVVKIPSNKKLSLLSIIIAATVLAQEAPMTASSTPQALSTNIMAEIAIGELFDRITILEIKMERIKDLKKLVNIKTELDSLLKTQNTLVTMTPELEKLKADLLQANKNLWDIEDAIRVKEFNQEFDAEFIKLARSVYYDNDARCRIKRAINELLGSHLLEEKSYKEYRKQ
jgi:hypothetical protein